MIHYYLERGHSLRELTNLTPLEKRFYLASMELTSDENEAAMKGGEG